MWFDSCLWTNTLIVILDIKIERKRKREKENKRMREIAAAVQASYYFSIIFQEQTVSSLNISHKKITDYWELSPMYIV